MSHGPFNRLALGITLAGFVACGGPSDDESDPEVTDPIGQGDGDGVGDANGGADGSGGGDATGGANGSGDGDATGCPGGLAARITTTSVDVEADILYAIRGYDGYPTRLPIYLATSPSGAKSYLAWREDGAEQLHVTPLSAELTRSGEDIVVPGADLSGLVAHDDGFALLTRRADPGETVPFDELTPAYAAYLVRYKGDQEILAEPLTGSTNDDGLLDYSNDLSGALAWAGSKYVAYFVIRGGRGHWAEGHYGDKLVHVGPDGGRIEGGWDWNCSHNEGITLYASTPDDVTPVCLSDYYPSPGLNVFLSGHKPFVAEEVRAGWTGGQFGSVVRVASGELFIGWASKGSDGAGKGTKAFDLSLMTIAADRSSAGERQWLTDTPSVAEIDLVLAPYGDSAVAIHQTVDIEGTTCESVCFGTGSGTHIQGLSSAGEWEGASELIDAPPTSAAGIAVLQPSGDLAWAYVPRTLDLGGPLEETPAQRTIQIARLASCRD